MRFIDLSRSFAFRVILKEEQQHLSVAPGVVLLLIEEVGQSQAAPRPTSTKCTKEEENLQGHTSSSTCLELSDELPRIESVIKILAAINKLNTDPSQNSLRI